MRFRIGQCRRRPNPPPFEDIFSIPILDNVPVSLSVTSNNNSETLLTVVVNTSSGGGLVAVLESDDQYRMM